MSRSWLVLVLAVGCAPLRPAPVPIARWAHVEKPASGLDYPAGDGAVAGAMRVLVFAPAPSSPRPPPVLQAPGRVEAGEVFRIEIRVPRADDGDLRTFRILRGRPGLRLLDGDVAATVGRQGVERRAIADSAGPVSFELEEIGD